MEKFPSNTFFISTYRLQFYKQFNFEKLLNLELIEYLNLLGISHIYSSPLLKVIFFFLIFIKYIRHVMVVLMVMML